MLQLCSLRKTSSLEPHTFRQPISANSGQKRIASPVGLSDVVAHVLGV